jgi:hypothetical protein
MFHKDVRIEDPTKIMRWHVDGKPGISFRPSPKTKLGKLDGQLVGFGVYRVDLFFELSEARSVPPTY